MYMWIRGYWSGKIEGWWRRLTLCWYILSGKPYWSDHTLITKADASRLVKFLNDNIKED